MKKKKHIILFTVSFIEFVRDKLPFFENFEDKIAKYWQDASRNDVIEKVDALFEEQKYMDVYETLNHIKYSKDIEMVWRIAKALYNLSLTPDIANEVRTKMIGEAHDILEAGFTIGNGKSNYHKWLAIIANERNGLTDLETKIREYPNVKNQFEEACRHNPRDFSVQYMLGRWHYEMANLTWLQRKIAKYLYLEPPNSTFQEAYRHLIKAEELQPRTFMPNLYVLGCVCVNLGQYYRARYYFNMALNLQCQTDCEKCCITGAKRMLTKLEKYDFGKDLLYEDYHFGFEG